MQVEAINITGTALQQLPKASEKVDSARKDFAKELLSSETASFKAENDVQPEEVLGAIKALTENGLYSVRFENNAELDQLVVKVVDAETDEVIREVPPEEILGIKASLKELRGQLVDTAR